MQDFKNFSIDKIHTLFSKKRILSYDSPNQHFENFKLIASISENIGIAEVLLRNKIDSIMCANNIAWLDSVPRDTALEMPKEPNPTHDKLVSIQSLGFWVKIAECYKIEGRLFDKAFLDSLDFKRYYVKNTNKFKSGFKLRRYHKSRLLLHLLRNIRNRAFHFENLYKLNNNNQPRLNACIYDDSKMTICIINIDSAKIQVFLNDLIYELLK
ncbi:hypothetical protein [Helicobacter sp. T3_23-1056]